MADVIHFPGHHWAHCTNKECTGCHLCHGGLASCTRCGGHEGSLTTDCPGYRTKVGPDVGEAVYAGKTDWVWGDGWVATSSVNSPAHYRRT